VSRPTLTSLILRNWVIRWRTTHRPLLDNLSMSEHSGGRLDPPALWPIIHRILSSRRPGPGQPGVGPGYPTGTDSSSRPTAEETHALAGDRTCASGGDRGRALRPVGGRPPASSIDSDANLR
jgi:hypothetical protein